LIIKGYGAVHSKENATLSNFALPTLLITIGSVRYILIKNNINYMVINAIQGVYTENRIGSVEMLYTALCTLFGKKI
tara:strand:+ start:1667 stop:1897 length:231 start_codon:yes stop_codon:yes gene_type:complete